MRHHEPTSASVVAFAAGLVFGLGLLLAGMVDPSKVLAFLDLAGPWDPSLALVMVGAIAVSAVAFSVARRRRSSLLGLPLELPTATVVDARLVLGAATFGAGWGLSGICPGPALVSVASGHAVTLFFVVPMLVGIALAEPLERGPRIDAPTRSAEAE